MQVEQIRGRSFNYRFSPAERQMGRELLCPNGENSIHPKLLSRLSTHTPPRINLGDTWLSEREQESHLRLSPASLVELSF